MVFVAASTLGRSHFVFSDHYFIPPHIQQTLLEITGRRCCASRASRWYSPMIFTPRSMRTKCERPSVETAALDHAEDHSSASGLACEHKKDILNIFLN